jgi:phosphoribosylglycinamide formyltransferase-1
MVAIADSCAAADCPYEIVTVLSDVEYAGILERARERNIPAQYIAPGKFRTKLDEEAEARFIVALREARIDDIARAGFMRILKGEFLRAFADRVINIHPSLLPAFPGLEAWRQALEYGVKVAGCTVHFVDQGIDSGAIISQSTVPVLDSDTAETLHARIQIAERETYPKALRLVAEGKVRVQGRRCSILA